MVIMAIAALYKYININPSRLVVGRYGTMERFLYAVEEAGRLGFIKFYMLCIKTCNLK